MFWDDKILKNDYLLQLFIYALLITPFTIIYFLIGGKEYIILLVPFLLGIIIGCTVVIAKLSARNTNFITMLIPIVFIPIYVYIFKGLTGDGISSIASFGPLAILIIYYWLGYFLGIKVVLFIRQWKSFDNIPKENKEKFLIRRIKKKRIAALYLLLLFVSPFAIVILGVYIFSLERIIMIAIFTFSAVIMLIIHMFFQRKS